MKIKSLILGSVAIAAISVGAISCSESDGTKTIIKAQDLGKDIPEVSVRVQELNVDTLIPVVNKSVNVELPVNKCAVGRVTLPTQKLSFIADGSVLNIDRDTNGVYKLSTKNKSSLNNQLFVFQDSLKLLSSELTQLQKQWYNETQGTDTTVASFKNMMDKYNEAMQYGHRVAMRNLDNGIFIVALNTFPVFKNEEEFMATTKQLSPELLKTKFISSKIEKYNAAQKTQEGMMFTDFTVPNSNGKEVKLSDYVGKGKYVLVDFWASWCGPCKGEIPNIKKVYEKFGGKDFNVVGVAVWDKPEATEKASKALGITWDEIVNSQEIATNAYGIQGIPFIVLFGPDGKIIKKGLRGEEIAQTVAKYVKPNKTYKSRK